MSFGQGQYVGLLLTDTEYRTDYNRVAGGDASFRKGEHFTLNGAFLTTHSQSPTGEKSQGVGATTKYSYSTRRVAFEGQLEHYDRGFRMDTAFINRVGITRACEYQDLSFYPSHPKFRWIKRINPFLWMTQAEDRIQGGSEAFYLPVLRFNFTRAGSLRLEYGARPRDFCRPTLRDGKGQGQWRSPVHPLAQCQWRCTERTGDVLRRGRAVSRLPAVGRPECPTAADRTVLQQNELQLRDVQQSSDGRARISGAHCERAEHIPVHASLLYQGDHPVRFLPTPCARRLSRLVRADPRNRGPRRLWSAVRTRAERHDFSRSTPERPARSSSRLPIAQASDRRDQPARACSIAAIRVEQRRVIERAQPAHMNVFDRHPGVLELISGRCPEIEMRLRLCREPAVGVLMSGEMRPQAVAHFIAARADAGTDGGDQIARSRAVVASSAATAALTAPAAVPLHPA